MTNNIVFFPWNFFQNWRVNEKKVLSGFDRTQNRENLLQNFKNTKTKLPRNTGNDHLIEFQLIEIVFYDFYHLIEILLITWPNFFRLFTWSNYSINWLKRTVRILAVDRNFKKPKIPLLELSINCQKRTYGFWQLIETF